MNTPRALNITAILAALMSFLQLLPQLLALIQPILDWLPKNGAMDTLPYALATFASARGIQVGYRWLTAPTGAAATLQDDLQAGASIMANCAAEGTPEAMAVLDKMGPLLVERGKAGIKSVAAERKEAKSARDALAESIAEGVRLGMEKAEEAKAKPQ